MKKQVAKTVFLELFGTSPLIKILDFLIVNEDFDYSMKDIASLSGVGYATLKFFWSKLEKNNIIIKTRIIGKAKMYKLNFANPVVNRLKDFYWDITKQAIRKEINKELLIKA